MTHIAFDTKGDHAYADITGGPVFKSDWGLFCVEAVKHANLKVMTDTTHEFTDGSRVYMAVLAESSFIATLSADGRDVRVDCYTCGDEGQPMPAVQHVCDAFQGASIDVRQIVRGVLPEAGVATSKLLYTQNEMAVSDVVYSGPIQDSEAVARLKSSIKKRVGTHDVVTLIHDFKPGVTMAFAFRGGHGDMHTYPEQDYLSHTSVGPCHIPFNLLADARPAHVGVSRGNILTFPRQPIGLQLAA